MYEEMLTEFIKDEGTTIEDFTAQLEDIQHDKKAPGKLKNFVNYLIACTEYPLFYKVGNVMMLVP